MTSSAAGFLRLMHFHRDAPSVVDDGDGIVHMNHHIDLVAITGQCLIDAVVHYFIDKMMQSLDWCYRCTWQAACGRPPIL